MSADAPAAVGEGAVVGGCLHVPGGRDHKYTRGVVTLAVGSDAYPGAGVLTALGAVRAGAGMVRLHSPRRVEDLVLARTPGVVCGAGPRQGRRQCLVAGCGVPAAVEDPERVDEVARLVREDVAASRPVVLDAGALTLVPSLVAEGADLSRCVLTPHPGEAAALGEALARAGAQDGASGVRSVPGGGVLTRSDVESCPVDAAARLAALTGATVVLKESRVHVAQGTQVLSCGPGSPWAASAGAGDVLAGVLGACLAREEAVREGRGAGPQWWDDAVDVGALAVGPLPVEVVTVGSAGLGAGGWEAAHVTRLAAVAALAAGIHLRAGVLAARDAGPGGGPVDPVALAEALPRAVGEIVAAR